MFSAATIAAVTPFLLGLTQASPAPAQDVDHNITLVDESPSALTALGNGWDYNFACNPYNDAVCYKAWWDYYRYCHPYDRKCYRDCDNYDDYQGYCKNWDSSYGKCYDKCYYDKDSCDKYKDCYKDGYGDDDSCYKKKRKDNYCHPQYDDRYDEDCYHEPPKDYCKPYDYDCHRKQPDYRKPGKPGKPDYGQPGYGKPDAGKPGYDKDRDEYKCHPHKDKDCYPGYPDYPDYDGGYDEPAQKPTAYVIVKFYNKQKGLLYEEKVWPDGEELYIEHKHVWVDYIKYYTDKADKNVRCLPMKNWFPWNPLPIYSYGEKNEYGTTVRTIELKKPQPVEVIRCDFP